MAYKPIQIHTETEDSMTLKKYRDFVIGDYNSETEIQKITNLPSDFDPSNFYMLYVNDDYIYFGESSTDDAEYSSLNGGEFILKLGYEVEEDWNIELIYNV